MTSVCLQVVQHAPKPKPQTPIHNLQTPNPRPQTPNNLKHTQTKSNGRNYNQTQNNTKSKAGGAAGAPSGHRRDLETGYSPYISNPRRVYLKPQTPISQTPDPKPLS